MLSQSLALRAHQPRQVEWSGVELEPTVALLDKNGVLRISQPSFSSEGTDGSSLTLVIETTNDSYAIELDNCPEPHVCGFLRDMVNAGLLDRIPETCAMRLSMMCLGTCTVDCTTMQTLPSIAAECEGLIDPLECTDYLACKPITAEGGGTMRKPGCPIP